MWTSERSILVGTFLSAWGGEGRGGEGRGGERGVLEGV